MNQAEPATIPLTMLHPPSTAAGESERVEVSAALIVVVPVGAGTGVVAVGAFEKEKPAPPEAEQVFERSVCITLSKIAICCSVISHDSFHLFHHL